MIRATIRLMAKTGFHGFTLADVGEAAGYSRGLPAHYFGRKDDLLSKVATTIVNDFRADIEKQNALEGGLPRISGWITNYARSATSKNSAVIGMLLTESAIHPDLRLTMADLDARGLESIADELNAGIRTGNVRPDINVNLQAKMIFAFMRGLLSFTTHNPTFDAPAVADEFIATSLRGISVPASRSAEPLKVAKRR